MSTSIVWLLTQLVKSVPSSHSKEHTAFFTDWALYELHTVHTMANVGQILAK